MAPASAYTFNVSKNNTNLSPKLLLWVESTVWQQESTALREKVLITWPHKQFATPVHTLFHKQFATPVHTLFHIHFTPRATLNMMTPSNGNIFCVTGPLFVWGIHRWPGSYPHKGQWHGASMFSLIYARIKGWTNNRDACDLIRHRAHYDVTLIEKVFCNIAYTKTYHCSVSGRYN